MAAKQKVAPGAVQPTPAATAVFDLMEARRPRTDAAVLTFALSERSAGLIL